MNVKGTAYLSRLQLLRSKLSDADLKAFLERFRARHPEFPQDVLPTTKIPAAEFLLFMDAIVDEIYDGDAESLWEVGERSAEWSLRAGPYRNLLEVRDIERFATLAPVLYANFFDSGSARSERQGDAVELRITGIPSELAHLYFEYSIVGFFRRGLELLGAQVNVQRIRGFSAGNDHVHYRLELVSTDNASV